MDTILCQKCSVMLKYIRNSDISEKYYCQLLSCVVGSITNTNITTKYLPENIMRLYNPDMSNYESFWYLAFTNETIKYPNINIYRIKSSRLNFYSDINDLIKKIEYLSLLG